MSSYYARLALLAEARPLFPVPQFTPQSASAFKGKPPAYTRLVCMVTHRTGAELERAAALDDRGPRPEDEQDNRPPAKFKPKGAKACATQKSRARGAEGSSTSRIRTPDTSA